MLPKIECTQWKNVVLYLINRKDNEGASASNFGDNGEKFGIHSTELGIVGVLRYLNVIVAFLPFCRLAVDVPKLGTSDAAEP